MAITSIGAGLTVHIACEYLPHHDWMGFFCWYSLTKNLPDAHIIVSSNRAGMGLDLFSWPLKCGVPLLFHRDMPPEDVEHFVLTHPKGKAKQPMLTVPPEYVCVRDFEEAGMQIDQFDHEFSKNMIEIPGMASNCKDENPTVFVNYSDGWGKFVTKAWLNKASTPLITGVSLTTTNMTVDELRLGRLWDGAARLYQSVSRG
jgi:hypothetical protein